MQAANAFPKPGLGDHVRFRGAYVQARGVVIDELTESFVQVKWDGVATPSAHRREDLQVDPGSSSAAGS